MPGKFLLDTNIVIALLAEDDGVHKRLSNSGEVFLPSIALGELYYGAAKSTHAEANLAKVDELAKAMAVLPCNAGTARNYGTIKTSLRSKGHPIPENDIWIASVARQHGLSLVTRDKHFNEVEGISVERW